MKFDAFYLVKLIFDKYFCYFDANRVAYLLQLHLDAIRVSVHERVNQFHIHYCTSYMSVHGFISIIVQVAYLCMVCVCIITAEL